MNIIGSMMSVPPEVLFVCVHNAGRSQIAAVFLNRRAEGRVRVRSAGTTPAAELNPAVIEVMREVGIDISQELPKALQAERVRSADVVITMGCGDSCPIYPGKRYEDWQLDDPSGRPIEEVRMIRDEVSRRVDRLLEQLLGDRRS